MSAQDREGVVRDYTRHALQPVEDALDDNYKMFSSLDLPQDIYEAACGGGCPLSFYEQSLAGKTVVDLGCGAGHDAIIAAKMGAHKVVGVDVTAAMLDRAARNTEQAGISTEVFSRVCASLDEFDGKGLPKGLREGEADLIISNGAINLCFNKPAAFRAAFRLAAPGGEFCFTDVVVDIEAAGTLSSDSATKPARWSN